MQTLVEKFSFQENLSICDGDDIGGDVCRHISSLGLNYGQSSKRAPAELVAHFGGPFEQSGVQVEDVTRIGLSAWRTTKQQRHLTVSHSL